MGFSVKAIIVFLVLSFGAHPLVCMNTDQHYLSGNEKRQCYANTKGSGGIPFWGIASCAAYKFCKDRHKTKDTVAESTPAQTEIVSRQSPGSELTRAANFQGIVYTKSEDSCRLTTDKPKSCAVPLAIIVPPSPVSSIIFCSSRPTPRLLAEGKFTFW